MARWHLVRGTEILDTIEAPDRQAAEHALGGRHVLTPSTTVVSAASWAIGFPRTIVLALAAPPRSCERCQRTDMVPGSPHCRRCVATLEAAQMAAEREARRSAPILTGAARERARQANIARGVVFRRARRDSAS